MYYVVGALRRCGVRGGGVRKTFTLDAAPWVVGVSQCLRQLSCVLSTEVQVSIWQVFAPAGSVEPFFLSFPPRTLKLACGESTTALKLPPLQMTSRTAPHHSEGSLSAPRNTVNFVSNTQFHLSERDRNDLSS